MKEKFKKYRRKNISVTINQKLFDILNEESHDLETSKSRIVEDLLIKYLEEKGIEMKDDF